MGRVLVCVAVISLATIGAAAAQDRVAHGEKVYTDQKCSVCHSIAGKGNAKGALDGVGSKLSANDIRAWIVNAVGQTAKTGAARKSAMKNYSLPQEDVDGLVAYLVTLKK